MQYHRAVIELILFVTFSAHIFMNVTQKNLMKIMKKMKNNIISEELIQVLIACGLVALLFLIASHLEFLFNQ